MKMTHHTKVERKDRVDYILDTVGLGEPMVDSFVEERNHWERLTTTGVLIVLDPSKKIVVTLYVPTVSKAVAVYCSGTHRSRVPENKMKLFRYNERNFLNKA